MVVLMMVMVLRNGVVFLLPCCLLISGGCRTAGKAPVRVPVGANVSPAVASGSGTLQDSFMHRQDWWWWWCWCASTEFQSVLSIMTPMCSGVRVLVSVCSKNKPNDTGGRERDSETEKR